jgi:two-component system sensor histidine kinase BarA
MCSSSLESSDAPQSCSILLVEDNAINQKVVLLMLGKFGIKPFVADNGDAAIRAVGERPFDLILMDLHMPGMGGIEAAARINEILGDKCPPIVALTADAVKGNEESVREQGLSGFLTKPVSSETLRACILEHTGREI